MPRAGRDVGPAVSAVRLYAEDLRPGVVFDLGSAKVSKEEILDFGRRFDPLPLHTDEAAAAAGRFGGIIAIGFYTLAVLQRLLVDAVFSRAVVRSRGALTNDTGTVVLELQGETLWEHRPPGR